MALLCILLHHAIICISLVSHVAVQQVRIVINLRSVRRNKMLWCELEETAWLLHDLYITLHAQEIYKMLKLKNKYQSKYYIDKEK